MERLFSMFPAGKPGVGLLLLRLVVSLTLIIQAVAYLKDSRNLTFNTWAVVALMLSCGVCFLVGLLTPATSLVIVLGSLGYALSWVPAPTANLFESRLAIINVIAIATAILFMGPGAFSIDARLFGRREIFIPHHNGR